MSGATQEDLRTLPPGKLLSNRSGLRKTLRTIWTIAFVISLIWIQPAVAQNKPTSLSDAQAAVEANLRTPEGKAYDEKLGTEFVQSHLGAIPFGNASRVRAMTCGTSGSCLSSKRRVL